MIDFEVLTANATHKEVNDWLKRHRFHAFTKQFTEFSGKLIFHF